MDTFEMRWYSNNYSLIIKGEQGEEMNSQLRIIANLYIADKETDLSNAFVSEGNGDREGDGINIA
jgi:hypothetical protein